MDFSVRGKRSLASRVSGSLLVAGLVVAGTAPAFAQHVVTDDEAGKLTLDALTATPRPVYRPVVAYRSHAIAAHSRHGYAVHTVSAVRSASYHHKASAPAKRRSSHRG
jgi:hypothetical protein